MFALRRAGEEMVFRFEFDRFCRVGRPDLAKEMDWPAVRCEDHRAYNIRSFETDGEESLLEIKTTNGHARMRFWLSRTQYEVATQNPLTYRIRRVFHFRNGAEMFDIKLPLDAGIFGPSHLADDLAVGRIHEQLDPVAVLVERVELVAGILELGLLDLVALRLDLGLKLLHRQPLRLGSRGARLAEAAGVGRGVRTQHHNRDRLGGELEQSAGAEHRRVDLERRILHFGSPCDHRLAAPCRRMFGRLPQRR